MADIEAMNADVVPDALAEGEESHVHQGQLVELQGGTPSSGRLHGLQIRTQGEELLHVEAHVDDPQMADLDATPYQGARRETDTQLTEGQRGRIRVTDDQSFEG